MVSRHAVTLGVILSISTKLMFGSCCVMYQIESIGVDAVVNTQSGSAIPDEDTTNGGSQLSIQSASRTGQSNGNTASGGPTRC